MRGVSPPAAVVAGVKKQTPTCPTWKQVDDLVAAVGDLTGAIDALDLPPGDFRAAPERVQRALRWFPCE